MKKLVLVTLMLSLAAVGITLKNPVPTMHEIVELPPKHSTIPEPEIISNTLNPKYAAVFSSQHI